MIERYTRPEMGHLWSIQNEWQTILNVEIAACEAMAELGEIPAAAVENIKKNAKFDVARINEIEKVTDHDIIAFLTNLEENVGEDSKYIHKGLTSSDVKDTAYCIMMRDAAAIILDDLRAFRTVLRRRADEFRHTPCIGRTHGIHAEPMTFGLKMLLWSAEIERDIERLTHAQETVSVGKLSGAVGTYSNIDPRIEELTCKRLGLTPVRLATQVIQRDRHAEFVTTLAIIAGTMEKIATEIRNLQRTDIREAEEFFKAGQKGSSAMPHKRNPINCERVSGMARARHLALLRRARHPARRDDQRRLLPAQADRHRGQTPRLPRCHAAQHEPHRRPHLQPAYPHSARQQGHPAADSICLGAAQRHEAMARERGFPHERRKGRGHLRTSHEGRNRRLL